MNRFIFMSMKKSFTNSNSWIFYQFGSSNSTLKGLVWSCVILKISATTSEVLGTTSGLSVLVFSFEDDLSLFQLASSSSFFFNKKIFSAEVFGHERIPFLSVQQSALKIWLNVLESICSLFAIHSILSQFSKLCSLQISLYLLT